MTLRDSWMVVDIVRDGAERFGDRLAVADPQQELPYAELAEAVWRMAGFLRRAGVEAGDRVAIVLPNSVRFAQVHFGILAAGSISVPCDFAVTAENLLRIYENCSPRFLITDQTVIGRLEGMLAAENFEKVFSDASNCNLIIPISEISTNLRQQPKQTKKWPWGNNEQWNY